MIRFVSLIPRHLFAFQPQVGQRSYASVMNRALAEQLARQDFSFTAFDDEEIIGCGGLVPCWSGRAQAWVFLSDKVVGTKMVAITRYVRHILDTAPWARIEASVDVGFDAGHRWMKILGFSLEAPVMRSYNPDGSSCSLYARVKCQH